MTARMADDLGRARHRLGEIVMWSALIALYALAAATCALADPTYQVGDVFEARAVILDQRNVPFVGVPPGVSLRWLTSNAAVASIISSPPEGETVNVRAVGAGDGQIRCRLDVGGVSRVGGAALQVVAGGPTPAPGRTPNVVSVILEPARPTPTPHVSGRWDAPRIYFARW